jgi:hypothetical protein
LFRAHQGESGLRVGEITSLPVFVMQMLKVRVYTAERKISPPPFNTTYVIPRLLHMLLPLFFPIPRTGREAAGYNSGFQTVFRETHRLRKAVFTGSMKILVNGKF